MPLNIVLPSFLRSEIEYLKSPYLEKLFKCAKITTLDLSYSDIILGGEYKCGVSIATQIAKLYKLELYSHYLVCEPAHLRLDGSRLVIAESSLLQLGQDECDSVIMDINKYFDGQLKLFYISEKRWLIGINKLDCPASKFTILDILGQDVNQYLSSNIQVNQIINDVQMILSQHPVNKVREGDGSLNFNTIWLWDKILNASVDYTSKNNNHEDTLMVLDQLHSAYCYGDVHSWLMNVAIMDNDIWHKFYIDRNKLAINLYMPYNNLTFKVEITPLDRFKLWRNNSFNQLINK